MFVIHARRLLDRECGTETCWEGRGGHGPLEQDNGPQVPSLSLPVLFPKTVHPHFRFPFLLASLCSSALTLQLHSSGSVNAVKKSDSCKS